jgi:hypothetical protein
MLLPYILVQRKIKSGITFIDNLLNSTAMDANDIIIVFINIALFSILTIYLFEHFLSEDIEIIAEKNINLYLNIIKNDPTLKEIFKVAIDKIIYKNKEQTEKYENWKKSCNQKYIDRSWLFTYLLGGLVLLIFIMDRFFNNGKPHINIMSPDFIKTLLFIFLVFSTEIFMLYFVFMKIYVIGEVDLTYKLLNSISKKL